ncbi:M18 family aminopeptidase [Marinobacterium jannaschii]|uniref:M18 family aminopeptidase n=1 Tax=Marinobacterium jannaschii TaxID=64970 RepID=UPI000480E38E|nr:M18 family aminopeptidase [Marinobacterium jannaschii]
MTQNEYNQSLIRFLSESPTPFHAVKAMASRLREAGFEPLREADAWQTEAGGRYYITRNDSSIIAWTMPVEGSPAENGFRMVGAHTDSPCLKVKPSPELHRNGYFQLGVEVYGGVLLNPWFDRDLSLAGRISYLSEAGVVEHHLIDFRKAIAIIPSLAIHLDREANSSRAINAQTYLPPVLGRTGSKPDFREILKQKLIDDGVANVDQVLDYELCFYDVQSPAMVGLNEEFIASARLDNLLSCFIGLQAMLEADSREGTLLVCNDHEEVGSMSAAGAQGPMLSQMLERIMPQAEERHRALSRSMMISADNAHAVHPNFADKHDANHGPLINQGAVIKLNANQRYASNSETSALYRKLAAEEEVPVQAFVVRSDMACGSTIGPITASEIGVKTLDIGVPQFAMHSIRELAGTADAYNLSRVLSRFYKEPEV